MKSSMMSAICLLAFGILTNSPATPEKVGGGCGTDWASVNCQPVGGLPCGASFNEVYHQGGVAIEDEEFETKVTCTSNGCLNVIKDVKVPNVNCVPVPPAPGDL